MVHALQETQRLLTFNGCLIDIQPLIEAPLIEVYQGNSIVLVEPDPSYDYEEDLRQAEAALTQVIQRGLFGIEARSEFDFLTHGSSAPELRALWAKTGADGNSPEEDPTEQSINEVYRRVEEIRQAAGQGAEVALHERARVIRLAPNFRKEELT